MIIIIFWKLIRTELKKSIFYSVMNLIMIEKYIFYYYQGASTFIIVIEIKYFNKVENNQLINFMAISAV